MVKVGINGFGRIGQNLFRIYSMRENTNFEVVAINGVASVEQAIRDLKYDSVFGRYEGTVEEKNGNMVVNGKEIVITNFRDPDTLNWKEQGVELVIDATGVYRTRELAMKHIEAGAKKVLITAPAKGDDITIVMGVNDQEYDREKHVLVSNASCTTNCLAPIAKVVHEKFGIKKGLMTTIHSYTNDQRLVDFEHSDPRRARAAALNMIPTTTGAAKAVGMVMPELKGKVDGISVRVPTPTVSIVDFVFQTEKPSGVEKVLEELQKASENELKGILGMSREPLVSMDFKGDPRSSIVDVEFCSDVGDDFIKILSWYDNEWGYSGRVVDLAEMMVEQGL